MNKQLTLLLTFMMSIFALQSFSQGVGFASTPITVHPSAIVEMRSNAKGFLAPRMTAAQRLAIPSPAMGLMVYDTDSSTYILFNGTSWRALSYNTVGLTLPYTGTAASSTNNQLFTINNIGNGGVAIVGINTATGVNVDPGIFGGSDGDGGKGVQGIAWSTSGVTAGVIGTAYSNQGTGIRGFAEGTTGGVGVGGTAEGTFGMGVVGHATAATGPTRGVYGLTQSTQGIGVWGFSSALTGPSTAVSGEAISPNGWGGLFSNTGGGIALRTQYGKVRFDTLAGDGIRMVVANANGVLGTQAIPGGGAGFTLPYNGTGGPIPDFSTFNITNNTGAGGAIEGTITSTTNYYAGVRGRTFSTSGVGVAGLAVAATGVTVGVSGTVRSNSGIAVDGYASSESGNTAGVRGTTASNSGVGVVGYAEANDGIAVGVRGYTAGLYGAGVSGVAGNLAGNPQGVSGRAFSPGGIGGIFANEGGGVALRSAGGNVQFDTLAGAGMRMVVADENGVLGTQAIPASGSLALPFAGSSDADTVFNITATASRGVAVVGSATSTNFFGTGVIGRSFAEAGVGVLGQTFSDISTSNTFGVIGRIKSQHGAGVQGISNLEGSTAAGVYGLTNSTAGRAVWGYAATVTGVTVGVDGNAISPAGFGGRFSGGPVDNTGTALKTLNGGVQFNYLAGDGNRMVVTDATGKLSAQPIPAAAASPWTINGNNIYNSNTGNVGVGTITPVAPFNVGDGKTVLFGNDTLGSGAKMMWIPANAAFRAGYVNSNAWNTANIGRYSFAAGYNAKASGETSVALGNSTATGNTAVAAGNGTASGRLSTGLGQGNAAGDFSFAVGSGVANGAGAAAFGSGIATGLYAVASGFATQAKAAGSTTLGMYNDITDAPNPAVPADTDRIFQLGNGFNDGKEHRMNAITVLRNGNTGIGVLNPTANLEVAGQVKINGGSPGAGKVLTSDENGLASWQTPAGGGGGGGGDALPTFKAIVGNTNNYLGGYNTFYKLPFAPVITPGYNYGGALTTDGTAKFTAPTPGVYHFEASLSFSCDVACKVKYSIRFLRHGSYDVGHRKNGVMTFTEAYDIQEAFASRDFQLNAGDTIEVEYMIATPDIAPTGFWMVGGVGDVSSTFTGHQLYVQH